MVRPLSVAGSGVVAHRCPGSAEGPAARARSQRGGVNVPDQCTLDQEAGHEARQDHGDVLRGHVADHQATPLAHLGRERTAEVPTGRTWSGA